MAVRDACHPPLLRILRFRPLFLCRPCAAGSDGGGPLLGKKEEIFNFSSSKPRLGTRFLRINPRFPRFGPRKFSYFTNLHSFWTEFLHFWPLSSFLAPKNLRFSDFGPEIAQFWLQISPLLAPFPDFGPEHLPIFQFWPRNFPILVPNFSLILDDFPGFGHVFC